MKKLIDNKDYKAIREALATNPALANEGIPYDEVNTTKAHPLHRICDGVFAGKYTDEEAVEIAKIFLEYGANINGNKLTEKQDTPLIAAASLHADALAIFYIERGAGIHDTGCHGGTALHWAAWCGRDKLVKRLVKEGADVNKQCIDFTATPLFWAVHGLKNSNKNIDQHLECVRILVEAGADKNIPNMDGKTIFDLASDKDSELKRIIV